MEKFSRSCNFRTDAQNAYLKEELIIRVQKLKEKEFLVITKQQDGLGFRGTMSKLWEGLWEKVETVPESKRRR